MTFEASHRLKGLPADHQCSRLHGHSYVVEVWASAEALDETGFVEDFGVFGTVCKRLDHRDLNEMLEGINPTAENLALWLHRQFEFVINNPVAHVERVRVHETATSWAEFDQRGPLGLGR
jgi:6-pyruvoyltetrahydropterin/6-carboxytetrahydropterin synthase